MQTAIKKAKKGLSILLAVIMVIAMIPFSALPASAATGPLDFTSGSPTGSDFTWYASAADGYAAKTLVLNNFKITNYSTGGAAVLVPDGTTIILKDGTVNTITVKGSTSAHRYGISAIGSLTIKGETKNTGTLQISLTEGSAGHSNNAIASSTVNTTGVLTISGVTVTASTSNIVTGCSNGSGIKWNTSGGVRVTEKGILNAYGSDGSGVSGITILLGGLTVSNGSSVYASANDSAIYSAGGVTATGITPYGSPTFSSSSKSANIKFESGVYKMSNNSENCKYVELASPTLILGTQTGAMSYGTSGSSTYTITNKGFSVPFGGTVKWSTDGGSSWSSTAPTGISAECTPMPSPTLVTVTQDGTVNAGTYTFQVEAGEVISKPADFVIGKAAVPGTITKTKAGEVDGREAKEVSLDLPGDIPEGSTFSCAVTNNDKFLLDGVTAPTVTDNKLVVKTAVTAEEAPAATAVVTITVTNPNYTGTYNIVYTITAIYGKKLTLGTQVGTLNYGEVDASVTFSIAASGFGEDQWNSVAQIYDKSSSTWKTLFKREHYVSVNGFYADLSGGDGVRPTLLTIAQNGRAAAGVADYLIPYKIRIRNTTTDGEYIYSSEASLTVSKAPWEGARAKDITLGVKDYTDAKDIELVAADLLDTVPDGGEIIAYDAKTGDLINGTPTVTEGKLTCNIKALSSADDGATGTCNVVIGCNNYESTIFTINFKVMDKTAVTVSGISVDNKTYDGTAVSYKGTVKAEDTGNIDVTNTIGTENFTYTWYMRQPGDNWALCVSPPRAAGDYKLVAAVPTSNADYAGEQEILFTIAKKDVTVKPKDMTVTVGTILSDSDYELEYTGLVSGESMSPTYAVGNSIFSIWNNDGLLTDYDKAAVYTIEWLNMGAANFSGYGNYNVNKTQYGTLNIRKKSAPSQSEPEVSVSPDPTDADEFDIKVPDNLKGEQNKVEIPDTEKQGSGTVPVIVEPAERAGEYVPKSMLDDGTVVFLVDETMKVKIVDNAKVFNDVKSSDWFSNNIDFVSARELFNGTSETTFSPSSPLTRGMFATVLWRLELTPNAAGAQFGDINSNAYYADAAVWGASTGVIEGIGNNQFAPSRNITRQDSVLMMYRYAKYLGIDVSTSKDLSGFTDGDTVSGYATEAMKWAVEAGIITGSDGEINPKGNATRAQASAILQRFVEYLLAR